MRNLVEYCCSTAVFMIMAPHKNHIRDTHAYGHRRACRKPWFQESLEYVMCVIALHHPSYVKNPACNNASNELNIRFVARPSLGNLANIPPLRKGAAQQHANQSLLDNSLAVQGPKLWNAMLCHPRVIQNLEQFKGQLTKFMLSLPEKTPISPITLDLTPILCYAVEMTEEQFRSASGLVG